jgi:hypothetical protein
MRHSERSYHGRFDRKIRSSTPAAPDAPGFVLTRVVTKPWCSLREAYTSFPGCLPFRPGDVEPPLEFLADITRSIYSNPNKLIINRFSFEPSANCDFIDPVAEFRLWSVRYS